MKKKSRCFSIAILILLSGSSPAFGGENYLDPGVEAFHSSENDRAIFFLEKAAKNPSVASLADQILGWIYWMAGEEERSFYHFFQSLGEEGWGKEIIIPEIAKGNLDRQQKKSLNRLLNSLAQRSHQPVIRPLSLWYSGCLYLEEGELESARRQFRRLNFWPVWQLIGPFDNQQNSGFDEIYPPEESIDIEAVYPGKQGDAAWRKVEDFDFAGYLDLGAILRPNWGSAAYLLSYVYSPRSRPVAFRLSADGRFKFWLNDDLVFVREKDHSFRLDQDVIGARLNAGWNKILLKSCLDRGNWGIGVRLTAPDGSGLSDLAASFSPQPYRGGGGETIEVNAGLRSYLTEMKKRRELTPIELFWLAQVTFQRDYREEAIEHFEKLISLCPRCAFYRLCLGKLYSHDEKPAQALREFKQALKQDPSCLLALYELGKYYIKNQLWEKALTYVQKVVDRNPGFLPGRLYRGLIFFHKDWLEDAYREVAAAARLHPESAWAHNNLGAYAEEKEQWRQAREEYRKALSLNHGYRDARERLSRRYRQEGEFKRSIDEYEKAIAFEPLNSDAFLSRARCYQTVEEYDSALDCCREVLKFCPRHHEARIQEGKIYYELGEREKAIGIWETALKQKPDDIWLREFLNHLLPQQNRFFENYEFEEQAVEELIASAPSAEEYPRASALLLLDQAIDQVFDDGSSTQMVHQVVKILNQKGIRQYSQIPVPASDTLKLEKAVTISPRGEESEATEISRGIVSMPALETGSIVEWKYTVERRSGGWLEQHYYQTFYFQDENPILKSQYVLALPEGKKFRLYQRGEKIVYRREKLDHNDIHIWESNDNPQIQDEYRRPPLRDLVALVSVSTIPSWDELARWQNSLIKDQFEIDNAIKEKLALLVKGRETTREKIKTIYDFIVSEIRYLNVSRGIFGKKPHRAVNIFANKYGDCKDKATLMIAMLNELGIEAHYAGIRVRSTGQVFLDVPSPQTNHILVYVPRQEGLDREIFLDGTAQYLSFPHLPTDDQAVESIVLLGDDYRYLKTPVSSPDKNGKKIHDRIVLKPDGAGEVEEKLILSGIFSQQYREALKVKGRRQEILEKIINLVAPGAVLGDANLEGLDDLSKKTIISSRYNAPHLAHPSPGKMVFSPLQRFRLSNKFARKAERNYALEVDFTRRIMITEQYLLPDGYEIRTLPRDRKLETPFASYRLNYRAAGDELVCRREFFLKVLSIPRDEYKEFRDFCLACDQAENEPIILEEKSGPESRSDEINQVK